MDLKKTILTDFEKWNDSIKSKIDFISIGLYCDSDENEHLYIDVCFKSLIEFKGDEKLKQKIKKILKTDKIKFYYSLPF
jgi:hypothetical protein